MLPNADQGIASLARMLVRTQHDQNTQTVQFFD